MKIVYRWLYNLCHQISLKPSLLLYVYKCLILVSASVTFLIIYIVCHCQETRFCWYMYINHVLSHFILSFDDLLDVSVIGMMHIFHFTDISIIFIYQLTKLWTLWIHFLMWGTENWNILCNTHVWLKKKIQSVVKCEINQ